MLSLNMFISSVHSNVIFILVYYAHILETTPPAHHRPGGMSLSHTGLAPWLTRGESESAGPTPRTNSTFC